MNDQKQTRPAAVPQAPRFAPLIPDRREQPARRKSRLTLLAVAFWGSLLVTASTLVFAIQYGIEANRAPRRMRNAQEEGRQLETEAAKQLASAEAELKPLMNQAADHRMAAIRTSSPELGLRASFEAGARGLEALDEKIIAAQQKVTDSKQAVADASAAAESLITEARLNRDRSESSLLYSSIAVAVGCIATAAARWSWRQAGGA